MASLVVGSRRGAQAFGLGGALASAMRKVVDALPESSRATAAGAVRRLLVDPETDLLARRLVAEDVPAAVLAEIRRAVFAGHKLRIHYAATDQAPRWRTVDPIGLVTVRDQGYLLAMRAGADRTYRLSRVLAAEELAEPAQRPDRVDLDRAWQERSTRFRTGGDQVTVLARVRPERREDLVGTALTVTGEEVEPDGRLRLELAFQDRRHAEWALWQLGVNAEALAPQWLRAALHDRATAFIVHYGVSTRESRRHSRRSEGPAPHCGGRRRPRGGDAPGGR